jgi:hypothetical protein
MRNLLALFGLVVLVGGGAGWYLGWYKLSFTRDTDGGLEIRTNVDTKKVETDSSSFFKNAAAVVSDHIEKTAKDAQTAAPAGAPGGTPGPGTTPLPPLPAPSPQAGALPPPAPALPDPVFVPAAPVGPAPGPVTLTPPR